MEFAVGKLASYFSNINSIWALQKFYFWIHPIQLRAVKARSCPHLLWHGSQNDLLCKWSLQMAITSATFSSVAQCPDFRHSLLTLSEEAAMLLLCSRREEISPWFDICHAVLVTELGYLWWQILSFWVITMHILELQLFDVSSISLGRSHYFLIVLLLSRQFVWMVPCCPKSAVWFCREQHLLSSCWKTNLLHVSM